MSIIYDALKKTEKIIHFDLKPATEIKPEKPRSRIKIIALYMLMVMSGLAIGNMVFGLLNEPAKKIVKNAPAPVAVLQPKEKLVAKNKTENLPDAKSQPKTPFVLNGIFFSQGQGYALVNNQIVRIGDNVDGAIVTRITVNEVELNSEGKSIKLTRSK